MYPREAKASNKITPGMHHPQRRNVTASMVVLKWSHTQKPNTKIVNPRHLAGKTEEEEDGDEEETAGQKNLGSLLRE